MSLKRLSRALGTYIILLAGGWALSAPTAWADTGSYFARKSLKNKQYSIVIDTSVTKTTRDNFDTPTFLLGSDLETIELMLLETELTATLDVLDGISLQLELPIRFGHTTSRYQPLQVSNTQTLDAVETDLTSTGVGDPTMTVSIELFKLWGLATFADLGTRIPLDDSPEGQPLPSKLPLSTGQNELFVGGGFNMTLGSVRTSLAFRHSFFPGNTTGYLVRRATNGSWVNGSTTAFVREAVTLALAVPLGTFGELDLRPRWALTNMPAVSERGGAQAVSSQGWFQELHIILGLNIPIGAHHILRPYIAGDLLQSSAHNPFFPIEAPKRGLGLAWQYTSY